MGRVTDKLLNLLPKAAVVAHDLFMTWLVWTCLGYIRTTTYAVPLPHSWFDSTVAFVLLTQGLVLWGVGLYRGLWRYASMPDFANIVKGSAIGVLLIVLGLFLYNRLDSVSRVVLLCYPFTLTAFLGAPRLFYRAYKDHHIARVSNANAVRTLILGAGQAGDALVRDMRRVGSFVPVGFLDDAPRMRGVKVQGLPVLGTLDDLASVARETATKLIVIAMPSVSGEGMRRILAACESTGLPFRTVPNLEDVLEGRSLPGELKELAIEDLLGRQPVMPDWKAIRGWLGGRSVLVTGAGGSIGSELCRQSARNGAIRLSLVEIDELAMMTICSQLAREFPHVEVQQFLGSCGDPALMAHAMRRARPDAVFHAAAYKQVPLLETHLREAVRNNVLATETVARSCLEAGVSNFVLISTDKAVDPVNVLGASKRLAEMACQALARGQATRFTTVRFGNVLDSAGSVVPTFREQIRRGGPVTVTDPDVTRYFMTIPEACLLILQAMALGQQEAIFTLDMGEPVPIRVLAEQMIRLAGQTPGKDIAIVYTGLRPGERLHETLFHADETYRTTSHPKILQAMPRDLQVQELMRTLEEMRRESDQFNEDRLAELLKQAVREFKPQLDPQRKDRRDYVTVVPFESRRSHRS